MNGQSQSGWPNFGPKLKLIDRLPLRKSKGRFRSKLVLKIDRDCQNYQANLKYMNICKCNRNVNDQRANIPKQPTKKHPLKDREVGAWNALVAKNCESKHSRQTTTLSLENSLNLSRIDFKCSKISRDQNKVLSEKMKMAAPLKSKDDSNTTSWCLEQPHHMDSSCPTQLKAIASLVHKANNVETSNLNNSALVSRFEGRSNPYQGEYINVGMDGTEKSNHVKKRRVSRKPNIPTTSRLLVFDNNDSNKKKGSQDEVMTKEKGMIGHTSEAIAMSGNGHKQTGTTKTNEVPNSSSLLVGKKHVQGFRDNLGDNSSHLIVKNHSRLQSNNASFMEGCNYAIDSSKHILPNEFIKTNLKFPNRNKLVEGNGKTNDSKYRRKQPLLEEMLDTHGSIGSDGAVQHDLTCRSMKRWRCIEDNEDDEMCDQHRVCVEDGTSELTQAAISKHCVRQCHCCSKPIDKPRWRCSRCC